MMRRRNNTEMKFIVLSSLLLGCLLIMTVKGTSARVVSGHEGNKNKLDVTGITTQKEPFEGTGAAHMRKLGFGTIHHEGTSEDSKNGKGRDHGEGTSKISGKEKDGLKNSFGSLQAQKNDHQKHMIIMGPKAYLKFTKFVIPRKSPTNTNTKCSQDCDAVQVKGGSLERSSRSEQPISEEPQGTAATKDENQSLSDAAKEIESLIFKDYKGRPSHKPPINNHGPNN